MPNPDVSFHTLPHADGSATYSSAGYNIIASVNGPIEPQRRDELPEEASIEVNLRPASGSGGTRERHIESLIHRTIRPIILTSIHPRTLIQLTLQLLSTPVSKSTAAPPPQSLSHLPPLPHLLHAALLALLAANIPLSSTYTAALVAVSSERDGEVMGMVVEPDDEVLSQASSVHVFAFTGAGELLLAESEGMFDAESWGQAAVVAERRCRGEGDGVGGGKGEREREDGEGGGLQGWLRGVVVEDVGRAGRWRGNL